MENLRWVQMRDDERDALLTRGGTGALSFSTGSDEPPLLLPVSYGYDAESSAVRGLGAVQIPLGDIFERPPEEVTFGYFRLRPETLPGRKAIRTD